MVRQKRSPGSCGFAGGARGGAGPPAMGLTFIKAVVPNIPMRDVKVRAEVITATNVEYYRPEGNCNPTNSLLMLGEGFILTLTSGVTSVLTQVIKVDRCKEDGSKLLLFSLVLA